MPVIHADFSLAGLCNGVDCAPDCFFRKLGQRPDYQALWSGQPRTALPPCVHRGKSTRLVQCDEGCNKSIRLKVFECAVYGECTREKRGVGVKGRCAGCTDYVAPPQVTINHGAGGLGDALLGLCAILGYRDAHPNENLVYAVSPGAMRFLRLFEGPPVTIHTHDKVQDDPPTPDMQLNLGYNQELRTCGATTRIERYAANLGNITPRLPKLRENLKDQCAEYAGAVCLAPCVADQNWKSRQYPRHGWLTVERMLKSEGHRVIIIDDNPSRLEIFPRESERALGWEPEKLVSLILNAACVVSNDSGPAHLAGILGRQTVVLSGATRADRIYNFYSRMTYLPGKLDCDGCWWHGMYQHDLCQAGCASLAAIPPAEIVETVKRVTHGN